MQTKATAARNKNEVSCSDAQLPAKTVAVHNALQKTAAMEIATVSVALEGTIEAISCQPCFMFCENALVSKSRPHFAE